MDLSPDGVTLRVQSPSSMIFDAEKAGKKTNIVLILSSEDYRLLIQHSPKKIVVGYNNEVFLRDISYFTSIGAISGKLIVNISWTHNPHHHELPPEKSDYDHSQSIDREQSVLIPISQKLKEDLDAHRSYLTYDKYIRDLLTFFTKPPHTTSREV